MFEMISFLSNHVTSIKLGSNMSMVGQTIGFAVLTARMVDNEMRRTLRYHKVLKPLIIERRQSNYPDGVRLDINGIPKYKGHTLH